MVTEVLRNARRSFWSLLGLILIPLSSQAQEKPNILVIWGDDIGWSNLSAYKGA